MNASFRLSDPWVACPHVPAKESLPEELQSITEEISRLEDQKEALEHAYDCLSTRYRGSRIWTFLRLDRFFITDLMSLWKKSGFLHCNHLNYLLRTLLVASGRFAPEDIRACWTHIWLCSPHQYLTCRLENGETVEVDLWGKCYGIPLGSHAQGFQSGSIIPIKK